MKGDLLPRSYPSALPHRGTLSLLRFHPDRITAHSLLLLASVRMSHSTQTLVDGFCVGAVPESHPALMPRLVDCLSVAQQQAPHLEGPYSLFIHSLDEDSIWIASCLGC